MKINELAILIIRALFLFFAANSFHLSLFLEYSRKEKAPAWRRLQLKYWRGYRPVFYASGIAEEWWVEIFHSLPSHA